MKVSESMKQQIVSARERITAAQSEIGQLMAKNRQPDGKRQQREERVSELQRQIAGAQSVISDLQRRLPMQEAVERAHDAMIAQMAADEREKARADRAAHDAAVKQAALQEWLKVPGQSETGFNAAWGQIAQQIATNRAVAAGAAETVVDHLAPIRQAAADALAARYGMVKA